MEVKLETYTIPDRFMDELLDQGTEVVESFVYWEEDGRIAAVDEWVIGVTVQKGQKSTFFHISEPTFMLFDWADDGCPYELDWVICKELFAEKCPRAAQWVEVEKYKW